MPNKLGQVDVNDEWFVPFGYGMLVSFCTNSLSFQSLCAKKKTNRLMTSNSNATIVSYPFVSFVDDIALSDSFHNFSNFLLFKGFECNLKIHNNINHSNGLSGKLFSCKSDHQSKNESETIAQQTEVWIEERKDEIGMTNRPL